MKHSLFGLILIFTILLCACSDSTKNTSTTTTTTESIEDVSTTTSTPVETATPEITVTPTVEAVELPSLTYMGRASVKIKTLDGKVIYIDPAFYEGDYSEPADFILVTHEHSDHNDIKLCTQKEGCVVIRNRNAQVDGVYQTFEYDNIIIEAVPSGGNANHSVKYGVGYIVTIDGISVYHAGDTSKLETMSELKAKNIDYALYPIDGVYNMDAVEATDVANTVGALHNIPIHEMDTRAGKKSDNFTPAGRLIIEIGQTISLKKAD